MESKKSLSLEGLRGVAAIMVILSHCVFTFYPYMHTCNVALMKAPFERLAGRLPHTLYSGGFAVCVFFVMSGYVLTRKFFSGDDASLRNAAVKRYIRLALPVAASILIACALMSQGMLAVDDPSLPGFIGNFYHAAPDIEEALMDGGWRALLFGSQTYNYVLWTIKIEFIGSMFLFAFLLLFGRLRFSALYAVPSIVLAYFVSPQDSQFLAMFLVGAYMHRFAHKGHSRVTHAAAIAVALYLGGYSCARAYAPFLGLTILPAGVGAYFWMGIGAALLVWVATAPGMLSDVMSSKPLAWLGNKSFSVYLLHTFVLSTVGIAVYHAVRPHGYILSTAAATLATVAGSVIVAIPFERLVDRPSVALANAFGKWAMKPPAGAKSSAADPVGTGHGPLVS